MRNSNSQPSSSTENNSRPQRFARSRPRAFFSAGGQEGLTAEGTERTPERALMLAVLEDAVACYAGRLKAPRENPKILRRQAAFWLSCEDWDSPFSFNNVCEALALDPRAIRERILDDAADAR